MLTCYRECLDVFLVGLFELLLELVKLGVAPVRGLVTFWQARRGCWQDGDEILELFGLAEEVADELLSVGCEGKPVRRRTPPSATALQSSPARGTRSPLNVSGESWLGIC